MSFSARVLAALLLVGVLVIGAYFAGKADERADQRAKQATTQAVAIEQHDEKAIAGNAVEQKAFARQSQTTATFARINLGVSNHALTDAAHRTCLDADGLRLWAAANAGADPGAAAPGQPDPSLSAAAPADDGFGASVTTESRRDSAPVSPLPQPAAGSGGLAEGNGQ